METLTECNNVPEALKFLMITIKNMNKILTHKADNPFYIKCLDESIVFITTVNSKYYDSKTKTLSKNEYEYFEQSVIKFFDLYQEDINKPLFYIPEGEEKKKANDSWLNVESEKIKPSQNRGIAFYFSEEDQQICIPFSELYIDAVNILRSGVKKPHYPLTIIYIIYKLIYLIVPYDRVSECTHIADNIKTLLSSDIFYSNSNLLEKYGANYTKYLEPLAKNPNLLPIFDQIDSSLPTIQDDQFDGFAAQASKAINSLNNEKSSVKQTISNIVGCNPEELDSKMSSLGLTEDNINKITNSLIGDFNKQELKSTIPKSLSDLLDK